MNRKPKIGNRKSALLPLLVLLVLTLLLTWPTVATLRTHVVDRQDPLLNAWIMAWEAHQLLMDPAHLYDANIFLPLHNTLALSETLLGLSLLVLPLQWITGDALLAYNIAFLFAFFSTALGTYLLALYLTGRRGAALVAAVAFTWAPYRMGHLSQVQLLAFGWLPLALIYLDRLLRGGERENPRAGERERGGGGEPGNQASAVPLRSIQSKIGCPVWANQKSKILLTLFLLLQALTSFYAALFSAGACALYVAGWMLGRRRVSRAAAGGLAVAAVGVAVVLVPLAGPYFAVQRELGAGWTLADNERFSASLQAYALATEGSAWGRVTAPFHYTYGPCCPPDTLFPGITPLVLSGVALWRGGGRRAVWLLVGVVGLLLSLGPTVTVWAGEPTGIPLPYRWLWDLPGFSAGRAPVRWSVLVSLALAVLAAVGVARLRWRGAWALALALVVAEFAAVPFRVVPAPEPPPSLAWLAAQPPTRILELPLVAERPREATPEDEPRRAWEVSRLLEAQFFSTSHWHATPDGYSGYVPGWHGDMAREVGGFPSRRSVALLRGLGVRFVVIHEADLDAARAARLAHPLPLEVREVARFGTDRVLELDPRAPVAPPAATLPLATLPADAMVEVPLVLTTTAPFVPAQAEPLWVEVVWEQGATEQRGSVRVPLPALLDEVAVLPLRIGTPPAGTWTLHVAATLPTGEQLRVERVVQVEAGADAPSPFLPVRLAAAPRAEGQQLHVAWTALAPPLRYYSLSVRLLDEGGTVVAQRDGTPGGAIPTLAWQPGDVYAATWTFDDLPPGRGVRDYRLTLLWYDSETGQPVWVWDGRAFVEQLEVGGER